MVVKITSVEVDVSGAKGMFALSSSNSLLKCLISN